MRYFLTTQLEEIYGPLLSELEKQHLRAARVLYKLPKDIKDHEILNLAKWQDLSNIYKRRINTEMYTVVKDNYQDSRLSQPFNKINTRKGKLLEVKRPRTEIRRNSLVFRGPVV